jgi:ribonuclease P protein component
VGVDTITSSREIDDLFRHGKRAAEPLLMVLVAPTPEHRTQHGRVLFVAGKKIGGAVVRNRCKRVMREACRRLEGPWPGRDVAIIARAQTAHAGTPELDATLARLLERSGVPR